MKPNIDRTAFGSITIEGTPFEHDVLIRLNGLVEKRKKKLSKAIYGTSKILSLYEARHVYEKGPQRLIIGTGQNDNVWAGVAGRGGGHMRIKCGVNKGVEGGL